MNKLLRICAYLYMRTSIYAAYLSCYVLSCIYRWIDHIFSFTPKDIGIFLHSPVNSDGHTRRFKTFYPYFKKDNIQYKEFHHFGEKVSYKFNHASRQSKYLFYSRIAWIRAFQIPRAIRYNTIILQRNLFPLYPDYNKPVFEKILRKQSNHILLDIWDPVHIWHPEFTYQSFKYVDKLMVNTRRLKNAFKDHFDKNKIFVWPIAVDPKKYKPNHQALTKPVKFFYTGSESNTKNHLLHIIPLLEQLSHQVDIELHIMGKYAPSSSSLKIIHHLWDDKIFAQLVSTSHVGLYPYFNANKNKNFAVAGKVLDYMGSKLPIIGADQGLSDGIKAEDIMIVANTMEEWNEALFSFHNRYDEMKKKADYAYNFVNEHLNPSKMYALLRKIIDKD